MNALCMFASKRCGRSMFRARQLAVQRRSLMNTSVIFYDVYAAACRAAVMQMTTQLKTNQPARNRVWSKVLLETFAAGRRLAGYASLLRWFRI